MILIYNSEFVSLSNHLYNKHQYPKTLRGESIFKKIVSNLNDINKKDELVNSLLELAKNDAEYA